MSFNRGRVERQYDAVFARLGQRFEDCAPSSSLGPAIEAIVDRRVRAVFTWTASATAQSVIVSSANPWGNTVTAAAAAARARTPLVRGRDPGARPADPA